MPSMNHLRSAPSTKNAKILMDGFISAALPRSTHQIGACIETEFGLVYESRSGLIALLHRLGLEYHKPDVIPRKLDEEKQKAFIESYNNRLNSLTDNEAAVFADAVHPTHAARPAGCWAPSQEKLAIEQRAGVSASTFTARSICRPPNPKGPRPWPSTPPRRFVSWNRSRRSIRCSCSSMSFSTTRAIIMPSSCGNGSPARVPDQAAFHPVERLWGLMHRNVTHNKCYATCGQFADVTLDFLRDKVRKNWRSFRDSVTDNFRVINPKDFRVLT